TRQPPLPTLFPYTTLFRSADMHRESWAAGHRVASQPPSNPPAYRLLSESALSHAHKEIELFPLPVGVEVGQGGVGGLVPARCRRSEEHTSELQSLAYLVCR